MCRPTDRPIVVGGMLTNSQATYRSIGYRHSANTSLIQYYYFASSQIFCSVYGLFYVLMGSCVISAPVGWVSVDAFGWYLIDMSAEMLANSWSPYRLTYWLTPSLLGWHWSADSRLTCWSTDGSVDVFFFVIIISFTSFIPKYNNYNNYHKTYMHTRTTHLSTHAILQSLHDSVGWYVDR